jgi:hypothetical protein
MSEIKSPEDWVGIYEFVRDQYPNGFTSNELRILRNLFKKAYEQETTKKKRWIGHYSKPNGRGGWGSFH